MRFEWDEGKNRGNQKKHGIAFEIAARVFDDPNALLRKDRIVEGEQRWHAIGMVETAILFVVHAYREEHRDGNKEEIVRIISAREADKRECGIYIQQTSD